MSRENVKVVREGLDAWNRGDDAVKTFVSEWYAPDVAMYALEDTLESRIYRVARKSCSDGWSCELRS